MKRVEKTCGIIGILSWTFPPFCAIIMQDFRLLDNRGQNKEGDRMREKHKEQFSYLKEENAIGEYERAVEKIRRMLSFTKAYYQSIDHEEIDLLLDMLTRAQTGIEGECYITDCDYITLYDLTQRYDMLNQSFAKPLLGAYYLHLLAMDAGGCQQLVQRIIQSGGNVDENMRSFFSQLSTCLKAMSYYESMQHRKQEGAICVYTING